ncbi:MAG: DUF1499 domain-containing protein [Candidatus Thalassarchaeaceae archaeon]|nr:MAG: hypothetical protein CND84_01695 [Marine Group II euryarchaeote MED-G35]
MTKNRRLPLFVFGILSAYLLSILSIHIAAPDNPIEPEKFPTSCPEDSINCSMIAPNHHRSGNITEIRINASLDEVMDEVRKWVDSQSGTTTIGDWPEQTHAVFRTLILRFPDDFVVRGFCDSGDSVLHVYSKSRLGISDLGVNKARVESFAEHMINVEMATSECV